MQDCTSQMLSTPKEREHTRHPMFSVDRAPTSVTAGGAPAGEKTKPRLGVPVGPLHDPRKIGQPENRPSTCWLSEAHAKVRLRQVKPEAGASYQHTNTVPPSAPPRVAKENKLEVCQVELTPCRYAVALLWPRTASLANCTSISCATSLLVVGLCRKAFVVRKTA